MAKEKIAITLDEEFVGELDRLVGEHVFQSRSQAIQEAVSEKLLAHEAQSARHRMWQTSTHARKGYG